MKTIKSYTDLEQSKKLVKILPTESADMCWFEGEPFVEAVTGYEEERAESHRQAGMEMYPCWSLAALLGTLPLSITEYIESERCQKTFHLNLFRSYYYCCSYSFSPSISDNDDNNTLYCVGRDNWVDACYEMILKLHELNLL